MKRKGSLRRISSEAKKTIAAYALDERSAGKTRTQLAEELTTTLGDQSPSIETLERMISAARSKSPVEIQWHIGLQRKPEHRIESEAIPFVLRIQEWACKQGKTISARQAFWISQLYHLPIYPEYKKFNDKHSQWLYTASREYAHYEIICELSNEDFDTGKLDNALCNGHMASFVIDLALRDIQNGTHLMGKAASRLNGKRG